MPDGAAQQKRHVYFEELLTMAMIYRVKDGPRDGASSEGHEIGISDLSERLTDYQCQFLDSEPPSFNINAPGDYFRYIVIEVCEEDTLNKEFDQVGFYVIANLDPIDSGFLYASPET